MVQVKQSALKVKQSVVMVIQLVAAVVQESPVITELMGVDNHIVEYQEVKMVDFKVSSHLV